MVKVPTPDPNSNPTLAQDLTNAEAEIQDQLPSSPVRARYLYDGDPGVDVLVDATAYEYDTDGTLLRCSTERHRTIYEALRFFNERRRLLRWIAEQPIYRTARFWCKRVWLGGRDG